MHELAPLLCIGPYGMENVAERCIKTDSMTSSAA